MNSFEKPIGIINTSRGGIVNEKDLFDYLKISSNSWAAIDTFNEEPYDGELKKLDNCFLTAHMGSMTRRSRVLMEKGACRKHLQLGCKVWKN